MELPAKIKGWVNRPVTYVAGEWNRMAPRERRLVAGLAGAVVVVAILLAAFLIMDSLSSIAEENNDAREALDAIAKHRDEYLDAKSRMMAQDVRIGTEPPQLAADLEAAAQEAKIQIPETSPRPPVPAGKRYMEHIVDVKLRSVDLQSLTTFLSKLETGRRLIVVTQLRIRRRFEGDKLDAELTASGYERVSEERTRKRPITGRTKT